MDKAGGLLAGQETHATLQAAPRHAARCLLLVAGLQEANYPETAWGGRSSRRDDVTTLPTGTLTFLFTDVEGSTPSGRARGHHARRHCPP